MNNSETTTTEHTMQKWVDSDWRVGTDSNTKAKRSNLGDATDPIDP